MKMKKYDNYKDSGIEWIGEIPEHWKVKKIKHRCYVKGRVGWNGLKSSEFLTEGYAYLVTGTDFKDDTIDWVNCYHIDEDRYNEDPFIQLKKEDLLITKDGTIGKLAVVNNLNKPACLNSGIFVVRSLNKDFSTCFLFWVLKSRSFTEYNDLTSYGSTIQHLYQNIFVEFCFAFPNLNEQHSISDFLNRKTAEIDQIITNKQKLIALYEEQKQAIIYQAVTKGLNPNTKFKDSGLEWLGEIPEHWRIKKLKYLARVQTGTTPKIQNAKIDYFEEGVINWFTPSDFKSDFILHDSNRKINNYSVKEKEVELFPENTVYLISIGATLGKVGISKSQAAANQQINVIIFNKNLINPHFGLFFLVSIKEFIKNEADYTTLPILNQSKSKLMNMAYPDSREQLEIVKYIVAESKKLDQIIEKYDKQIELLKEYRTALISNIVTGKIKISNTFEL